MGMVTTSDHHVHSVPAALITIIVLPWCTPGAMTSSRMAGWAAALDDVQRTTSNLWSGGSALAQVVACNALRSLIRKHKGAPKQLRQKLITELQVRPVHASAQSVLPLAACRACVQASSALPPCVSDAGARSQRDVTSRDDGHHVWDLPCSNTVCAINHSLANSVQKKGTLC